MGRSKNDKNVGAASPSSPQQKRLSNEGSFLSTLQETEQISQKLEIFQEGYQKGMSKQQDLLQRLRWVARSICLSSSSNGMGT